MKIPRAVAACTIGSWLAAAAPASAGHYVYREVAVPACCSALLSGINSRGEVVGVAQFQPDEPDQTFIGGRGASKIIGAADQLSVRSNLTDNGLMVGTSQTTTGGAFIVNIYTGKTTALPPVGQWRTTVSQVDARATVVGTASRTYGSSSVLRGYLYAGGKASLLHVAGSSNTTADVINAAGEIAGTYQVGSSDTVFGYTLKQGKVTTFALPGAPDTVIVTAIDDTGRVIGWDSNRNTGTHAFLVTGGVAQAIDDPDPSVIQTFPSGFGPGGEVVGAVLLAHNNSALLHAVIYANQHFTLVAPPPKAKPYGMEFDAVNASGAIAGAYEDDANGTTTPFIATCPADQAPCD